MTAETLLCSRRARATSATSVCSSSQVARSQDWPAPVAWSAPPHWACRAGSPVSVGLESSVSGACDSAQSAIWSQSGAVGSVAFPAVTIR